MAQLSPTEQPWPYWMLRYIGSDDREALDDLVWSVGGSPPYGGISYDEASAIYDVIQGYLGPGQVPAAAYASAEQYLGAAPQRKQVLDLFRCADAVQSTPNDYDSAVVERGLAMARSLRHRGAEASFLCFQAGWHHRSGNLGEAHSRTMEALSIYLELAEEDPSYEGRVRQCAQNAIGFAVLAGSKPEARRLLEQLGELLDPAVAGQFWKILGSS